MRVLAARGGEFEGEFAFGVVRQLFEALLSTAAPGVRAELLSGAAALAEPLFDTRTLADAAEETETPFAMFHGLYWLAANVASYLPTVLVIDDLHWADTPSLRWLSYLARRLDGVPLLVIAAMRPPDQGREPELLAELLADPEGTAIRPGPLTADAIAALVRRRVRGGRRPRVLRRGRDGDARQPAVHARAARHGRAREAAAARRAGAPAARARAAGRRPRGGAAPRAAAEGRGRAGRGGGDPRRRRRAARGRRARRARRRRPPRTRRASCSAPTC